MGWDTVDEHSARFKGWVVVVLPELRLCIKDLHIKIWIC